MRNKIIEKGYAINLTTLLVKNFHNQLQTIVNIDKLLNKDQGNINISKDKIKNLRKS